MQVMVCDQTVGGPITHQMMIDFLTENITLRDLIKSRVYQEVKDTNAKRSISATAMFQLSATEAMLNEAQKHREFKPIEFQTEYDKAIDAFLKGRYFVLIDNHQPMDLDEMIVLHPDKKVNFIKLVYLTGG
jgi:hypothetical protein